MFFEQPKTARAIFESIYWASYDVGFWVWGFQLQLIVPEGSETSQVSSRWCQAESTGPTTAACSSKPAANLQAIKPRSDQQKTKDVFASVSALHFLRRSETRTWTPKVCTTLAQNHYKQPKKAIVLHTFGAR